MLPGQLLSALPRHSSRNKVRSYSEQHQEIQDSLENCSVFNLSQQSFWSVDLLNHLSNVLAQAHITEYTKCTLYLLSAQRVTAARVPSPILWMWYRQYLGKALMGASSSAMTARQLSITLTKPSLKDIKTSWPSRPPTAFFCWTRQVGKA